MHLRRLYLDARIADSPEARRICARIDAPAAIVEDAAEVYADVQAAPDPIAYGKEVLFLTENQGAFIRACPGTRDYICCGYQILHVGTYCHMDCAYCILQAYFHPPLMQYFVNHSDLEEELRACFARRRIARIGTGEFTDSLIWERWTRLSRKLVPIFADQETAVLELKTKTAAVQSLRGLRHRGKTIVAWSLNTPGVIAAEERRTAGLAARLQAAADCAAWGYPLAFHFDPIVIYEGCAGDYRRVLEQLFAIVPAEQIAWISLGSFRFVPPLKSTIARRFPDSKLIYGEFVPGRDGKMRYFKPLRIEIYRTLVAAIRQAAPDVAVYLCMEDEEVWQKTLGFRPQERGGLARMLDERAVKCCGLRAGGLNAG